ncbi:MAG: hypothetical protein HFG28_00870 [Eubacterium sp.]|nr:hypothetical protein [Eubacterium sp.]
MKRLLSINAVLAFIWLDMFTWGIYKILSTSQINMDDALQSLQKESASMEEINAVMINLAQRQIGMGSVIATIGGIGLIVCMNWLLFFLIKEKLKFNSNK